MSLSRAKNIFMPMNINAIVLFYKLTTPWPVLAYFYGTGINGISHIVHNALCLPPQILHKLLLRNALGNMQTSQEYFTTIVYAKFGGQTECIMDNWKIGNCLQATSREVLMT